MKARVDGVVHLSDINGGTPSTNPYCRTRRKSTIDLGVDKYHNRHIRWFLAGLPILPRVAADINLILPCPVHTGRLADEVYERKCLVSGGNPIVSR